MAMKGMPAPSVANCNIKRTHPHLHITVIKSSFRYLRIVCVKSILFALNLIIVYMRVQAYIIAVSCKKSQLEEIPKKFKEKSRLKQL